MISKAEAKQYLHEHIPITSQMGVDVDHFDETGVILSAPLNKNINHRDTAFGGSLSALAILAGWSLVHICLMEENIPNRLVIQKSRMDFHAPAESNFTAACAMPGEKDRDRFIRTLKKRKRARITLHTVLSDGNKKVGEHEGMYVAMVFRKLK